MNHGLNLFQRNQAFALLFLLPLATLAQTTNITRPIQAGQMDLMSVPLIVPGGNTLSNIFPNVPSGSLFYFWDADLQSWTGTSYSSSKGWDSGTGNRVVLPGESFFFKPPGDYTVSLTGDPPSPPCSVSIHGNQKISALGYFYPVDIHWTDTQLASQLPPGSLVSFWTLTNSLFRTTFLKAPAAKGGGWGNAAANYMVHAGDGFVVKISGTNFIWGE